MSRDFFEVEVLQTILPFLSSDPKRIVKWVKSESGSVRNSCVPKDFTEFQEKAEFV